MTKILPIERETPYDQSIILLHLDGALNFAEFESLFSFVPINDVRCTYIEHVSHYCMYVNDCVNGNFM